MKRVVLRAAFLTWLMATGVPPAFAQSTTIHKPLPPIGPADWQQCNELSQEWDRVCEQISTVHQQCLNANQRPRNQRGPTCSIQACQDLHTRMDECPKEKREAVAACQAQVEDHRKREQEMQRQQDWLRQQALAEQRAREEAERQRQEAAQVAYEQQLAAARRARAEYERQRREAEAAYADRAAGLDPEQIRTFANLRRLADDARARAERLGSSLDPSLASIDDQIRRDVEQLARQYGAEALATGLRHAELETLSDTFETVRGWYDNAQTAARVLDVTNDFLRGVDVGDRASGALGIIEFLGDRLTVGGIAGRGTRAIRASVEQALGQLDLALRAFDDPGRFSYEELERATDPRAVLDSVFGQFVPGYDEMRRASRLIDAGKDAFTLFFAR